MLRVRHLPLAAQRVMPWKNGGGSTREVAVACAAAAASGFSWRISVGTVASDGPFSMFPGVDRLLWLLRGDGLVLDIAGRSVRLDRPLQRCDFPGEAPVQARRIGGPVEDLNVMVDRATTVVAARILELAPGREWVAALGPGTHVVLALGGGMRAGGTALQPGEAVQGEGPGTLSCAAAADAAAAALMASFRAR